jgi:hypothetical protein
MFAVGAMQDIIVANRVGFGSRNMASNVLFVSFVIAILGSSKLNGSSRGFVFFVSNGT